MENFPFILILSEDPIEKHESQKRRYPKFWRSLLSRIPPFMEIIYIIKLFKDIIKLFTKVNIEFMLDFNIYLGKKKH